MSFLDRLRSTQDEKSKSEEEKAEDLREQTEAVQSRLEKEHEAERESLSKLNEMVFPVLEDVGKATWGEGKYETRPNFDLEKFEQLNDVSPTWRVFERHEGKEKFEEYSVVLNEEENLFQIRYSRETLSVPLSRADLEEGFLKAAREGGPYTRIVAPAPNISYDVSGGNPEA